MTDAEKLGKEFGVQARTVRRVIRLVIGRLQQGRTYVLTKDEVKLVREYFRSEDRNKSLPKAYRRKRAPLATFPPPPMILPRSRG